MDRTIGIIERGLIAGRDEAGWRVASLDRDGIVTPPLKPLTDGDSFMDGERVYYFIFPDGTGRIICSF